MSTTEDEVPEERSLAKKAKGDGANQADPTNDVSGDEDAETKGKKAERVKEVTKCSEEDKAQEGPSSLPQEASLSPTTQVTQKAARGKEGKGKDSRSPRSTLGESRQPDKGSEPSEAAAPITAEQELSTSPKDEDAAAASLKKSASKSARPKAKSKKVTRSKTSAALVDVTTERGSNND